MLSLPILLLLFLILSQDSRKNVLAEVCSATLRNNCRIL